YRLPSTLVESLAVPLKYGRPILSKKDVTAERDLDALCTKFQAVGVFAERPVVYPYLAPRPVAPEIDDLKVVGLDRSVGEVRKALSRLEDISDRVRAYAARLVMDPTFHRDRDDLRDQWRTVPSHCRPWLPLDRTTIWRPANASAAAFQVEFDAFCDRYGLLAMTTWELPHPA